jgi:hypothetical protein
MINPTPGSSNTGVVIKDNSTIVPAPLFSQTGFVRVVGDDSFTLTVSIPDTAPTDAMLCVTTNGCEPTEADVVEGGVWTQEIAATTVVSAKIYSQKALPIRSTVHSYIFHPEATALPIFSIVTNPDYFYSEGEGILVGEPDDNPNYENDWRRPINLEYFKGAEHTQVINQLCETRVQGGYTRRNLQKSLAVYANKRFGVKRFSNQLWRDKPEVTEVKSFILRNGGNNFSGARINDQVAQTLIGRFTDNVDWQAYEPAIYYINGVYQGITDLRERSNEDYVLANHGLDDDEIDMFENWTSCQTGTVTNRNAFIDLYNSDNVTLDKLSEAMDVDNFLDMFVVENFAYNTDYPGNNIMMWRPIADGGRWRWILKDIDYLARRDLDPAADFCNHVDSVISVYTENQWAFATKCLKLFPLFYRDDPQLVQLYIDRMSVYLGDIFQAEACKDMIDEMVGEIRPEYLRHMQVYWSNVGSESAYRFSGEYGWLGYVGYMRDTWVDARREGLYNQLKSRYNLGNLVDLSIENGDWNMTLNNTPLAYPIFNGKWYVGRDINLSAGDSLIDDDKMWQVYSTDADGIETLTEYYTPELTLAPADDYVKYSIKLTSRVTSTPTLNIDGPQSATSTIVYYTLQGIKLTKAPTAAGIYLKVSGSKVEKVAIK